MDLAIKESADRLSVGPQARRFDLLQRVEYRLARTREERGAIYRLRYRAYLKEGAIGPNDDGFVTDCFDDAPNSWIFGIHLDDDLVSSVRISVSTPDQPTVPSCEVFPDVMAPLLSAQHLMVDPTRFVADPDLGQNVPDLPFVTLRLSCVACAHFKADTGLASVRPEHQAFYRRVFHHRPIADARAYPGLIKPISLMAVDYPAECDAVYERHPYFRSTVEEQGRLFRS